ncbi:MAG TPA: ABC transporter permease [Candidatus Dormibacteraeota bacterium]|nr:ABC transporter permease [Candidatus Dormibacteraeota bacterium]
MSHQARDLAASRAHAPHTSMLMRMLVRAAVLRRGRAASALFAMVVAAAVATAMLNLYVDVQAKLRREFRNYGANIILVGKDRASLPAESLARVDSILAGRGIAAPFGLIVARTGDGQPVVVAGTDFERVKQLDKWWSVSRWPAPINPPGDPHVSQTQGEMGRPDSTSPALVGVRALPLVAPKGQAFDLTFQGHTLHASPAGTVQTGAAEDSRIYVSLNDFVQWTGVQPSTIEVAASGTPEDVASIMNQLGQAIPAADVRPVRQIMEGEARVLGKTRATLLAAAALIILTAALCVLSTLMGWVFDRRRDFAIMKALGASERLLNGFFAAEAAALGATGAVVGFLVGIGIAAWIGRVNFHAPVVPRWSVLPIVLAGSIAVTLLSAILPISLLRRVQPAVILRGE